MVKPECKTVYWTVTTECNQRCHYCWLDAGKKQGDELDAEQWINIFSSFVDMGLGQVKVTGGEPLLHWSKIKPVLDFLLDHELYIRLESNAVLLCGKYKDDIIQFLKQEKVVPISVSLDSHIPEHHDQFRGMKGAFEKTIKALKILKQENVPFCIVTVLHRDNFAEIKNIIDLVNEIGPRNHQINLIMHEGRTKQNTQYQINRKIYEKLPLLVKQVKAEKKNVTFNVPYVFDPLSVNFLRCRVGTEICGLLPNGDIAVCSAGINEKTLTLGNALIDDIEDIWAHAPQFLTLRKDSFDLNGVCGNCMFARYCMGHCRAYAYSVYKELDAPYPVCQMLYEYNMFPEKYMIDQDKNCSYPD